MSRKAPNSGDIFGYWTLIVRSGSQTEKRNVNNAAPPRNETSHRANVPGAAEQQGPCVSRKAAARRHHCGRVRGARGQGRWAEMCQASSWTGFQSNVHHYRSVGPYRTATRQQNITADMATAPREQGRSVESKGEVPQHCFSCLRCSNGPPWPGVALLKDKLTTWQHSGTDSSTPTTVLLSVCSR